VLDTSHLVEAIARAKQLEHVEISVMNVTFSELDLQPLVTLPRLASLVVPIEIESPLPLRDMSALRRVTLFRLDDADKELELFSGKLPWTSLTIPDLSAAGWRAAATALPSLTWLDASLVGGTTADLDAIDAFATRLTTLRFAVLSIDPDWVIDGNLLAGKLAQFTRLQSFKYYEVNDEVIDDRQIFVVLERMIELIELDLFNCEKLRMLNFLDTEHMRTKLQTLELSRLNIVGVKKNLILLHRMRALTRLVLARAFTSPISSTHVMAFEPESGLFPLLDDFQFF